MRIGAVEYLVGAAGAGLIIAAIGNRNPIDIVRQALTGAGSVRPLRDPATFTQLAATAPAGSSAAAPSIGNPTGPPDLVTIGQGGHRLERRAAAKFREWEAAFGRPIVLTDSYRSYEQQAAAHRSDPNRFASPDTSAHVDGLAVDVNLPRTTGGQSTAGQPLYDKMAAAGARVGWVSYGHGARGTDTWHFSYGTVR